MADKPLVRAVWDSWRHGPYNVTVLRRLREGRYECQVGGGGHPLWRNLKVEVFGWELWRSHRFSGLHSVYEGRPDLSQYEPPPDPPITPLAPMVFPEDTQPVPPELRERIDTMGLEAFMELMRGEGNVDPIFIGAAGRYTEQRLAALRAARGEA